MKEIVNLEVDTKSKEFMFHLGELFASGNRIRIMNPDEVYSNIEKEEKLGYAKSFNMMINYWAINLYSPSIENISAKPKNIFLICPVRNATKAEKEKLRELIKNYEEQGFNVHYPERNTNQNPFVGRVNTGGYNICLDNARAIANAQTVVMFYNKESTGSMFDLGVTYQLMKQDPTRKFILANSFEFDETNVIDQKINQMLNMNKDGEMVK